MGEEMGFWMCVAEMGTACHGLIDGGKEPRAILYKWLGGNLSSDCLLRLLLSRLRRQLLAQQGRMRGYPSCSGYDEGMDM